MTREEILIELTNIFRDVFDDESMELSENITQDDIEDWDSIGHVYLTVQIEEKFNIELGEEMSKRDNVKEIIDLIQEKIK
jgi:acyl carrier protein